MKKEHIWQPLLIAVAALVAFLPVLQNDFMNFDDGQTVYYNRTIMEPTLKGLLTSRIVGMYVPVSAILYALTYKLGDGGPFAFHLVSLLLHAGVSVLLYRLLRRLNASAPVAFAAGLLAAVSPMKAEPVAWVAAQTTLVFTLFYVCALLSWINFREQKNNLWLAISVFCFLLASLSKSAAVTLPILLPVLDWYLGVWKNNRPRVRDFVILLPFLAVSLVLGLYTFTTRTTDGAAISIINEKYGLVDRVLMVSQAIILYLYKFLAPFNLVTGYPFVKTDGVWPVDFYIAPFLLGALAYSIYWLTRRDKTKVYVMGAAFLLIPLSLMLPFATVGNFELRGDRYVYFSAIGAFWLLFHLIDRYRPKMLWPVCIGAALLFATLSWKQSELWKNDQTLFEYCLGIYPNDVNYNCNAGYGALIQRDFQKGIDYYTKALNIDPTVYEAYNGRGQAYMEMRRFQEAANDFSNAIRAGIVTPKLFFNRGKCLVILGKPQDAIPDLDRSIKLERANEEAYFYRAFAAEKTGDMMAALHNYTAAISQNPNYVEAFVNRGLVSYNNGTFDQAIQDYSKALELRPEIAMIWNNRANAYFQTGRTDLALADANRCLQINPNYGRGYETRSRIYQALGQLDKAAADQAKWNSMNTATAVPPK
jgi:protein O-mannosyl-transferase